MNASETLVKLSRTVYEKRVNIEEVVKEAAALIGPVWPLKNGIACNPLLGLEHKEFWEAIEEAESLFSHCCPSDHCRTQGASEEKNSEAEATQSNIEPLTRINEEKVNRHFIKWVQAFLDQGQATWKMPDRHLGFYRCWRLLAIYDRLLIRTDLERKILASFPEDPEEAIEFGMKRLGIQNHNRVKYLAGQLGQLAGWAGYVKWQTDWESKPSRYPIDLVQFLAVRIIIACLVEKQREEEQFKKKPLSKRAWTKEKIERQEEEYRNELTRKLLDEAKKESFSFRKENPLGQLVFCIDVRSESFRKQLEAQGNWETFGFAGFFGIPISLKEKDSSEKYPSCPVLLKPQHDVVEISYYSIFSKSISKIRSVLLSFYKGLKYQFGTPFALAEAIGPWSGIWMAFKSLNPQAAYTLQELHEKKPTHNFCCLDESIPLKEQITYAQSALSMIGLTQDFAPLVIFCGHGSSVQNNPHASALNCGACGGNAGGPNARLMASILNSPLVRCELNKRGIQIPEETLFLGAEHDTTTDNVTLFCDEMDMATQPNLIKRLQEDLKSTQLANTSARMPLLGSLKGAKEAIRKSVDWSETRPEWGLAKNAAFVVGPRTLTENLDLKSRCFLHSYDWKSDEDGTSLETILTAPMVVAEWINTQYFFSAFNPVVFGSGSKITHNVVGKIGVMQGNGSDLMHGLPLQSIYSNDLEPYHIPMRLLTVVLAPRTRIDTIVKKHPTLQDLFFNQWVKLVAIDPTDLKAYQLEEQEVWNEISGAFPC
ncbi:MAG: DUF2309 domain-containing protein [Chlamydiales bacterium]|nr:DUF2309 domain-containing protein [Chlamydiales bacterium]